MCPYLGAVQGPPSFDDATVATLTPFVEVELVYETGRPGMDMSPWRAIEVWTRNRVYSTGWDMICVEVRDRDTGQVNPTHTFLGAKLSGGQTREDDAIEVTYPCPRPGCEAVFEHPKRRGFMSTSTVVRVVLRLRVLTVPHEKLTPTWDELTDPKHKATKLGNSF